MALAAAAAICEPTFAVMHLPRTFDALPRVFVDTVSIVLEAGPFVLAGALAATLLARFAPASTAIAAAIAAFAPGCDCSMNGFAIALRRCPAPLAGAALTWGAVCNPIALYATATVLGNHLCSVRATCGLVAAGLVALTWSFAERRTTSVGEPACCSSGGDLGQHLESALRLLLFTALASSVALVAIPGAVRAHASPLGAALAGALLSPCSTADAVIAKILASSPSSQAALLVAGQCLDLRQLILLRRHFGIRRMLLALLSGVLACVLAARIA